MSETFYVVKRRVPPPVHETVGVESVKPDDAMDGVDLIGEFDSLEQADGIAENVATLGAAIQYLPPK